MKKFIALLSCMLFILGSIGTVFADENTNYSQAHVTYRQGNGQFVRFK